MSPSVPTENQFEKMMREDVSALASVLVVQGPRTSGAFSQVDHALPVPTTIWKAPTTGAALQLIQRRPDAFGLLILHDRLGSTDPLEFLRRARRFAPGLPAILV